jgi:hypothetical protein
MKNYRYKLCLVFNTRLRSKRKIYFGICDSLLLNITKICPKTI